MTQTADGTAWSGSGSARGLWLGIAVSLALHAALLSLHFKFPEASRILRDRALDIILVNARSENKPSDPQALAQVNLDGGGDTDEDTRASTPLPPAEREQSGDALRQAEQRLRELEEKQHKLLTQSRESARKAPPAPKAPTKPKPRDDSEPAVPDTGSLTGLDLYNSGLALTRLEAEIERNVNEYNKRPRVKNIGTRAEEYRFAQYVEDWRQKVQRVGKFNYPAAARGKLSGNLTLTVRIKSDGSVERVDIDRPSEHNIFNEAARQIVYKAAPFAPFPPAIKRDTDVLEITRKWTFIPGKDIVDRHQR